jgi:succinate dehydrogenase hydrophobic anchor subunit
MSQLYRAALSGHVLAAVLGLGSIASIAIIAARARRGRGLTDVSIWLAPLLGYSAFSLAVMLVTGVLLDLTVRGAFSATWWFRVSVLLLVATGALHGQVRRVVRKGLVEESGRQFALRRIERLAYAMCVLIAVITVLMEVKPF